MKVAPVSKRLVTHDEKQNSVQAAQMNMFIAYVSNRLKTEVLAILCVICSYMKQIFNKSKKLQQ